MVHNRRNDLNYTPSLKARAWTIYFPWFFVQYLLTTDLAPAWCLLCLFLTYWTSWENKLSNHTVSTCLGLESNLRLELVMNLRRFSLVSGRQLLSRWLSSLRRYINFMFFFLQRIALSLGLPTYSVLSSSILFPYAPLRFFLSFGVPCFS